jgi:SAM-dependent methyltransferase
MLKNDDLVLDVATGSGEPGLSAAKRVDKGRVIGVDISEEMLRVAEEKAKRSGISNYETRVQDSSKLSFETDSFDAVICRFGVMWFPDMQKSLREMVRVLRPERELVVSVWGPQTRDPRMDKYREAVIKMLRLPTPSREVPGSFRCSEPGMITSLLNNSGLQDVEEFEITLHARWESSEKMWEFLTDTHPTIATAWNKLNSNERNEARIRIVESLKAAEGSKGEISSSSVAWIDWGTKLK